MLAGELACNGAGVTIIDANPNRPVSRWAKRAGKPEGLAVIDDVTEETIIDRIEEAARACTFVIVDLEGTASMMVWRTRPDAVALMLPAARGAEPLVCGTSSPHSRSRNWLMNSV